jgi:ubiquinone/menaquinone biosynthesis C-methylase UbiE
VKHESAERDDRSGTLGNRHLKCIVCEAALPSADPDGYRCPVCGAEFPVVRDVARFVDQSDYAGSFGFQWARFARVQLDSASRLTRSRDTFVTKTGWTTAELAGERILDAGCGMGRFTEVCCDAGAEVYAVDLSNAVEVAAQNLRDRKGVHFFQADIFRLPFADESFDRVFSIGVLHHTPDTKAAFYRLVRLVRPGGRIAIWVYSTKLRAMLGSELLRPVTSRLPRGLMLQATKVAIPLYYVHRFPLIGRVSSVLLPTSLEANPTWRWLDTFDWYTPRYQWKHSDDEVVGWFKEAGLTDIRVGEFPVSVSGKRPPRRS